MVMVEASSAGYPKDSPAASICFHGIHHFLHVNVLLLSDDVEFHVYPSIGFVFALVIQNCASEMFIVFTIKSTQLMLNNLQHYWFKNLI